MTFVVTENCIKCKYTDCVEVCPVGAIVFTDQIPEQDGDGGYVVNLRGESWAILGYPTG